MVEERLLNCGGCIDVVDKVRLHRCGPIMADKWWLKVANPIFVVNCG